MSSTDLTTDDVRKLLAAWPAEPAMVFEETTQGMHVGVRGMFFYETEPDGESGPSICIDEGEANLYDAAWSLAHKVIALAEENARILAIVREEHESFVAMREADEAAHKALEREDPAEWYAAALAQKKLRTRYVAASNARLSLAATVKP